MLNHGVKVGYWKDCVETVSLEMWKLQALPEPYLWAFLLVNIFMMDFLRANIALLPVMELILRYVASNVWCNVVLFHVFHQFYGIVNTMQEGQYLKHNHYMSDMCVCVCVCLSKFMLFCAWKQYMIPHCWRSAVWCVLITQWLSWRCPQIMMIALCTGPYTEALIVWGKSLGDTLFMS